ncbi:MAG: hypothetical protein R2856_22465 [Caldilineaceae bacterium]
MATEVRPVTRDRKQPEAPIDPATEPIESQDSESNIYIASQWTLVWRKFRKHKLAMLGGVVTILIYLVALFAEFLAPFDPGAFAANYTYAPPQLLSLFVETEAGRQFLPTSRATKWRSIRWRCVRTFVVDEEQIVPVRFFAKGTPYKLWGLIPGTCT